LNQSGPLKPTPPTIAAGELVMQLHAAPPAAEGRGTTGAASTSPLETLRRRYNLGAIEPVFTGLPTAPQRQPLGTTSGPDTTVPDLSRIYLVHVAADADIRDLVGSLQRDPNVDWAEPNYLYKAQSIVDSRQSTARPLSPLPPGEDQGQGMSEETPHPNDPFLYSSRSWGQDFPDLWGLFKIEAPAAWRLSQGEGVVVAVVDTGIDIEHEDLAANVWHNPGEIPGNGTDDDGNGFVDDVSGWDFTHCAEDDGAGRCLGAKEPGPDVSDQFGHGTHVAGTIAAVGNNGIGIIGVAPRAHIMAVKAFDDAGFGPATDLAAALVYAADNGAGVINASWGGAESNTIRTVVEYIIARGVVMVASAGNDALPIEAGTSPADLPEVIAVGALTHTDSNAFFSNFGGPLALVAPGGGDVEPASAAQPWNSVLSLWAHDSTLGKECYRDLRCTPEDFQSEDCGDDLIEVCAVAPWAVGDHYLRLAGTSMAAPHVSGVAALIRGRHPEFSREQVQQVLLNTADDLGPSGWDPVFGYGRVNARRAVTVDAIPVAEIMTPRNRAKVWNWQFPLSVQGNALAPGAGLRGWRLELREQDTGEVTEIRSNTSQVTDGTLGMLELSQVQLGKWYVLDLTVEDMAGNTANDTKTFLVPNPLFGVIPFPNSLGAQNLTLSADGTRVALTDTSDAFGGVWLYDTLTRELRPVATGFGVVSGWLTGDGRLLSYDGFLPDGSDCHPPLTIPTGILYDVDSTSYICLPLNVGPGPMDAHGQRIAFTSTYRLDPTVDDQDGSYEVFVYDVHANTVRQITRGPNGPYPDTEAEVRGVTISQDGGRVAFTGIVDLDPTASTGGDPQVFLYDYASETVRQLTGRAGTPPYGVCPSLSGDGERVAYATSGGIVLEEVRSGVVSQVADDSGGPSCPHLSADGNHIAFTAAADLDPTVENEDLYPEVFLMDLTTGTISQVTDTRLAPFCRPWIDPCFPLVADIDAIGDVLLLYNPGAEINGIPLPLNPAIVRVVRRQPNRPPALEVPDMITAAVNVTTNAALRATDPDGFPITFFVQLASAPSLRPPQWVLSDHADGTADIAFTPRLSDAGTYTLRIAAFNEAGGVAERDIQLVIPSPTPTPNWAATFATKTATPTPTATPTATLAPRPTFTPSATQTSTPTASRTVAPAATPTQGPTPMATPVPFATPTASSTITSTATPDPRPSSSGDSGCAIGPVRSGLGEQMFLLVLPAVLLAGRARARKPNRRE
jgi:subtilisin family serine protease